MVKKKYLIGIAIIALVAGFLSYWLTQKPKTMANLSYQAATIFPEAKALPHFSLTNQLGQSVDNKNLNHHWTLLFFGFTHCPDVCPTTLANLNKMVSALPSNQLHNPLQVILVTVDPGRDNPVHLKHYLNDFNTHFIGLTGSQQTLTQLQKFFGVATHHQGSDIEHTASVFLINPEGQWQGLFSPPLNSKIMLSDFLKLAHQYKDTSKQVYDINQQGFAIDHHGKWLVINYWATWCQPCYQEIPELNALYKQYKNQVTVVGVNYDGLSIGQQRKFATKFKVAYPLLATDLGKQYDVGDIQHLPATILINPKGNVAATLFGPQTVESLAEAMKLI